MKRRVTPPVRDSPMSTTRDALRPNCPDRGAYEAAARISGDCVVAGHHLSLDASYDFSSSVPGEISHEWDGVYELLGKGCRDEMHVLVPFWAHVLDLGKRRRRL